MNELILDLLRHGEPAGGHRFRGHGIDDPLSELGWQQLQAAARRDQWDHVVSSPLLRCRAFAERLAGERGVPLSIEADLREVGFGVWEGRSRDEVKQLWPEQYQAFYRDPVRHRPEGAEDLLEFAARVRGVLERLVEQFDSGRVLLVVHAGVIRAALGWALQAEPRFWYRAEVSTGGMTRLRVNRHGPQLQFHNKTPC